MSDLEPTGIRLPNPDAEPRVELVDVHICREAPEGAADYSDVFAVMLPRDSDSYPSLKEWRTDRDFPGDREVVEHEGIIIDEGSARYGLGAPRIRLVGRDVTRLVMEAADFERRAELCSSGLAKLTPEERKALGVG